MYQFGPFQYDPLQRLLFREGQVVPLAPKAIDTLHALIDRRGQVAEKAELMKLVWPDCVVEEVGLARNISLLRKALGDDAEKYIETVPRRGYRFAAEVRESAAAAASGGASRRTAGRLICADAYDLAAADDGQSTVRAIAGGDRPAPFKLNHSRKFLRSIRRNCEALFGWGRAILPA